MRRSPRGDSGPDTELNLVPIMNLFTALIPFLLLSAAFIQVKVINGSVPAISDGSEENDAEPETRPVVMNVQILPEGYAVSASGDEVAPEELETLGTTIPAPDGDYDADALAAHLEQVKGRFPKSDTVIVVPEHAVRYEEIVRVMDASRELLAPNGDRRVLFPKVVVSSRVQ